MSASEVSFNAKLPY